MEVKVRATTHELDVVQVPAACWKDESVNPCAVWSKDGRTRLSATGLAIELSSGGVLQRQGKELSLMRGSALVESTESVSVEGLWGRAQWETGRVLLRRDDKGFRVRSLDANVDVRSVSGETGSILPGFQVVVRPSGLRMDVDVPQSVTWGEWIRSLVEIKGAQKSTVREVLSGIAEIVRAAQSESSDWQRQLAERGIASDRHQDEMRRQAARRQEQESLRLRQMFRAKNLADGPVED